ncbi:MAG TPA: DUF4392 domain-containing protein [Clostridia bacterium]|nr:DUF4392 domain-containing protein [Clostridia bacterium]
MNNTYCKQLENVIRKNLGQRGMDRIELKGELFRAAESLFSGETVFIITGFVIKDVLRGETDGPLGAVSLAGALEKLGKKAVLLTDGYSGEFLYSCRRLAGLSYDVEIVPDLGEKAFFRRLLETYRPTHVVAIERPGRAADGRCYSMRGEDLSDIVPNTDILFEDAGLRGITTIAVGDGGNEVGMGKLRPYIVEYIYKGRQICAAAAADFLIIAGVSNWGGHALAAALSVMAGRMLLHDGETEKRLLEVIIEAGAVDGCTKKSEMTVDGLSLEENLEVLERLRAVVRAVMK